MPDGNCEGCGHCCHDETICTASKEYQKTCTLNCHSCDYCDEGEAYCDLDVPKPAHKYRVMCVTWYEEEADTGEEAKRIIEMNCPDQFSYMRAEKIA